MSANFSPTMEGYSGVEPFRFWCQKVLPLVYDDSLSYYELLCKVVDYINRIIDDLSATETNVDALKDAYDELEGYVNNYFDNLDIQTEIDNKLNEMVRTGAFDEIVTPIIVERMPSIVTGWLTENVDPVGSAVVVDSSLTIGGAAADAEVTGDNIFGILDSGIFGKNLADPDDVEDNRCWSAVNSLYPNSDWSCTSVAVEPNTTYTKDTANANFCWFTNATNENLGAIPNSKTFTTPAGCTKIRISHKSHDDFCVLKGTHGDVNATDFPFDVIKYIGVTNDDLANYVPVNYGIKGCGVQLASDAAIVAPYDDMNTLPVGSIVTYVTNVSSVVSHIPSGFTTGTVVTMDYKNDESTGVQCQLVISVSGRLWTRHKFSTWRDWHEFMSGESVPSYEYATVATFSKIGVVGDSYESGGIYIDEESISGNFTKYSWPSVMGRRNGLTVSNYSTSGLSTRTWLSSTYGLSAALADSGVELYLLCLGINDYGITGYLGDIDDITDDYTQNPDTFYGNYARIYEQLAAHESGAKFVFVVPQLITTEYKNAIIAIAGHYQVPYIVSTDDAFFNSSFYTGNKHSGHPIAITYGGMAMAYERLLAKTMVVNAEYFTDVH